MSDILKDLAADIEEVIDDRADQEFGNFGAKIRQIIRDVDRGRPSKEGEVAYAAMMEAVELYRPIITAKLRADIHARALAMLTCAH